jgi:glycolate oxidase
MLAVFDSIDGAAGAVSTIIRSRIIPTTLEFMDHSSLQCVEDQFSLGIPTEAEAVLIIELDGEKELVEKQVGRINELIRPLGLISFKAAADAEAESREGPSAHVSGTQKVNPEANEDIVARSVWILSVKAGTNTASHVNFGPVMETSM